MTWCCWCKWYEYPTGGSNVFQPWELFQLMFVFRYLSIPPLQKITYPFRDSWIWGNIDTKFHLETRLVPWMDSINAYSEDWSKSQLGGARCHEQIHGDFSYHSIVNNEQWNHWATCWVLTWSWTAQPQSEVQIQRPCLVTCLTLISGIDDIEFAGLCVLCTLYFGGREQNVQSNIIHAPTAPHHDEEEDNLYDHDSDEHEHDHAHDDYLLMTTVKWLMLVIVLLISIMTGIATTWFA